MGRAAPRNNPPRTSLRKRLAKQVAPTVEKQGEQLGLHAQALSAHEHRLRTLEKAVQALTEYAAEGVPLEEALAKVGLTRQDPNEQAHEE